LIIIIPLNIHHSFFTFFIQNLSSKLSEGPIVRCHKHSARRNTCDFAESTGSVPDSLVPTTGKKKKYTGNVTQYGSPTICIKIGRRGVNQNWNWMLAPGIRARPLTYPITRISTVSLSYPLSLIPAGGLNVLKRLVKHWGRHHFLTKKW